MTNWPSTAFTTDSWVDPCLRLTPPCPPQLKDGSCLPTGTAPLHSLTAAQVRPRVSIRDQTTRRVHIGRPPAQIRTRGASRKSPKASLSWTGIPPTSWRRSSPIRNGTPWSLWWKRVRVTLWNPSSWSWAPKRTKLTLIACHWWITQTRTGRQLASPERWGLWGTSQPSPRSTCHRRPPGETACTGSALGSGSAPYAWPIPMLTGRWQGLFHHTWLRDWCQCFLCVHPWNHTPFLAWSVTFLTFRARSLSATRASTHDLTMTNDNRCLTMSLLLLVLL